MVRPIWLINVCVHKPTGGIQNVKALAKQGALMHVQQQIKTNMELILTTPNCSEALAFHNLRFVSSLPEIRYVPSQLNFTQNTLHR